MGMFDRYYCEKTGCEKDKDASIYLFLGKISVALCQKHWTALDKVTKNNPLVLSFSINSNLLNASILVNEKDLIRELTNIIYNQMLEFDTLLNDWLDTPEVIETVDK